MGGLRNSKRLTVNILGNPHIWFVALVIILLSIIHYREVFADVGLIQRIGTALALGLNRHTLERILFLIPVTYASARISVKGGIVTLIIAAAVLSPRALFFSPEPRDALFETGGIIFTGALLVSLLYSLQKRKLQTAELEMTNKMLNENRELQKQILRRNRELLNLNSITRALFQSLELETVADTAAKAMLNALEAEVSWVRLIDDTSRAPITCVNDRVSAEAVDELMENIRSAASLKQTNTPTGRIAVPAGNADSYGQTQWHLATTSLKSKDSVLGIAGVATTRLPFDKQQTHLLDAIGNQIAGAIERCRLYAEAQLARDVRGELLRQVITTQEEERKRIARELHDDTCQSLTALRLGIESLVSASASSAEDIRQQLLQYRSLCQQIEEEVDKLILDLRPTLLDDLGLIEAIRFYTHVRFRTTGIGATVKVIGKERRLLSEIEATVFRVAQEGISNIIKHARAASMTIELQYNENQLTLRIEDDGCGFEASELASSHGAKRGMGLLGMRERINLIGGSLNIISKPGAGTLIEVVVLDRERKLRNE